MKYLARLSAFLFVLFLPALALASVMDPAIPDPGQGDAFVTFAVSVFTGPYGLLAKVCVAVIAAVYLLRKYGSDLLPFLGTDRGGALLALLASVAGALFVLPGGTPLLSMAALLAVFKVLAGSTTAFNLVKKVFFGDAAAEKQQAEEGKRAAEYAGQLAVVHALGAEPTDEAIAAQLQKGGQ